MEDSYRPADQLSGAMPPSRSFLTILLRRKWIVLQVASGVFLLSVVIALLQPRIYEATAWMLMAPPPRQSNSDQGVQTKADVWDELQNDLSMHIRMIRRQDMAAAVATKLGLQDIQGQLLGGVSAAKVAGASANLIAINYRGPDPAMAQKIATAWARAYEQDTFTRSASSTVSAIQYIEKQITAVESQLRGIEQQIALLEQEHLTTGIGSGGGAAATSLGTLLNNLMSNRSEQSAVRAQLLQTARQLKTEPRSIQETEEEPTFAARAAEEQLAKLNIKLQEMRADYYEDSPEIVSLKAQIAGLEDQLTKTQGMTRTAVKSAPNPTHQRARDSLITLQAQLDALVARERTLQQQIGEQRQLALGVPPTNIRYTELNRKVAALEKVHSMLLSRLYELQLQKAMAVPAVQVVKEAELPGAPVEPRMETIIGLGFIVGLLLAVIIAVVVDQVDDTYANLNELDENVHLRLLGALPRFERPVEVGLPLIDHPRSPFSNAVRMLASAVRIEMERNKLSSLCVTSAGRAEGKSMVSSNLAICLARAGTRVLLVDSDLHRPVQHQLFKLTNDFGLSNVLVGSAGVAEMVQATSIENLSVLASGSIPPSPVDLLSGDIGEQKIREINEAAEIVIWDTPPAAVLADATVLATVLDRTLFVVGHRAKRSMVKDTVRNMQDVGARMLGIAANQVRPLGGSYYYYYYYHPYGEARRKIS